MMPDSAKYDFLVEQGYSNIRFLPNGVVGLIRLLYTTGLCIGLNDVGWEERYCYPNRELAIGACNALHDMDDEPLIGYVAKRVA